MIAQLPVRPKPSFGLWAPRYRSQAPLAPQWKPVLGNVMTFRRRPLEFLMECLGQGNKVVQLDLAGLVAHAVFDADGVMQVLQKNGRNYTKQTPAYDVMRLLLGEGLLTSEGDFWLRQRRIAQPAFQKKRIESFGPVMLACAKEFEQRLDAAARSGQPTDMHAEMMRLTLQIAGMTLMSSDVTADADRVGTAMSWLLENANFRIGAPLGTNVSLPTAMNRKFSALRADLNGVVLRMVEQRRAMPEADAPNDLLTLLMYARDEETGEQMSDAQLRDEVMTMFLAGHETTANALSWSLHLLADAPEVSQAVADEIVAVLGDRDPTADDLTALPRLHDMVLEVLRLYPPAWLVGRAPIEDDEVCGVRIPSGTITFVSPWVMHRHPEYWREPLRFDPSRFSPGESAARPRGAFIPFVAGPRQCIGNHFAMVELMLILAWVMPRFVFDAVPGSAVVPEPVITLRPHGGLPMRVRRRPA